MFPNNNNNISSSSSSDADHQLAMLDRFLSSDVNVIAPNYSKHLPPSFLFPFSPSFVNDLNEFTFQYQHHHQDPIPQPHPFLDSSSDTIAESHQTNYMPVSSDILGMATNNKTSTTTTSSVDPSSTTTSSIRKIITQQQETSTTPRKRSAKKDRHSKIVTAQGPRDRRMRLSFDIARRFFALQDMLGFDKASKTVEWLLTKSRSAIKELSSSGFSHDRTKASTAGSSTSSECEVISVVDNEEGQDQVMKCSSYQGPATRNKEKRTRQTRKATFHPLARESRIKARARARERTMERSLRSSRSSIQLTCMRSSSSDHQQPFEEESSHSYDVKSNNSLEVITVAHEVEKPQSSDQASIIDNIIKKSFVNTRELSGQSSSIFCYSNRSFPGFDESWELHNHPISTDHSTRFCIKPWETNNDRSLP